MRYCYVVLLRCNATLDCYVVLLRCTTTLYCYIVLLRCTTTLYCYVVLIVLLHCTAMLYCYVFCYVVLLRGIANWYLLRDIAAFFLFFLFFLFSSFSLSSRVFSSHRCLSSGLLVSPHKGVTASHSRDDDYSRRRLSQLDERGRPRRQLVFDPPTALVVQQLLRVHLAADFLVDGGQHIPGIERARLSVRATVRESSDLGHGRLGSFGSRLSQLEMLCDLPTGQPLHHVRGADRVPFGQQIERGGVSTGMLCTTANPIALEDGRPRSESYRPVGTVALLSRLCILERTRRIFHAALAVRRFGWNAH